MTLEQISESLVLDPDKAYPFEVYWSDELQTYVTIPDRED